MNYSSVYSYLPDCSPEEEARENFVNVTVTSKPSTELPITDFQDFVSDMQKTISSLRKQVRILNIYMHTHTRTRSHIHTHILLCL